MAKVQHIEEDKIALFERVFGAAPTHEISAAGRINIIGEHVDYCGGRVMPASLNLNCRVFGRVNTSMPTTWTKRRAFASAGSAIIKV